MIEVRHLYKAFNSQILFHDFSYTFSDIGLYLIYGYSGCGKTTFMNMLLGLESIDQGEVILNGIPISQYTNHEILEHISYLTQDTYLLPYLTIDEHFKMYPNKYSLCVQLLEEFDLSYVLHSYPDQLSGGEKQRVCVLKAMAMGKRILFLDEPTASLDTENKKHIFTFLKKVSKDMLIICISHDKDAFTYCDYALDFQNKDCIIQPAILHKNVESSALELANVSLSIKKKFQREKKKTPQIILAGLFCITLLLVSFCIQPEKKLVNALGSMYHLNYLNIEIDIHQIKDLKNMIESDPLVKEMVYEYRFGRDYRSVEERENSRMDKNKLMATSVFHTLPSSSTLFYPSNALLAGNYPEKKNEILLGHAYASKLAVQPEYLVGKEIELNTGKGMQTFIVTGVLSPLSSESLQYLKVAGIGASEDAVGYFTSVYTKTYEEDDELSFYEKQDGGFRYQIYFDNFTDLNTFENQYKDIEGIKIYPIENYLHDELMVIYQFSSIAIPIAIASIIITLLFYVQSLYNDLDIRKREYALYMYYGYNIKNILKSYWEQLVFQQIRLLSISSVVSLCFMYVLNTANTYFNFYPYTIFSFHWGLGLILLISLLLFSISSRIMLLSFRHIRWFDLLKERRDLL